MGSKPTIPHFEDEKTKKTHVQIRKKPVSGLQKRSGPTHPHPWWVYQLVKKMHTCRAKEIFTGVGCRLLRPCRPDCFAKEIPM